MESYLKFLQNYHGTEETINTHQQNKAVNSQNMFVSVSETYPKYVKRELCNSLVEIKQEFGTDTGIVETNLNKQCTCDTKNSGHCFRCHVVMKEVTPAIEYIKVESVPSEVNIPELKTETEKLLIKNELTLNESACQQEQLGNVKKAQLFECDKCEFKTKYTIALKRHSLNHRNFFKIYRCNTCEFKTKYKSSIEYHMLVHNDAVSFTVQMYQCDSCKDQIKREDYLERHFMDPSEGQMFQCDSCENHANRERGLEDGVLNHDEESSEVQMYQCYNCGFNTKHKNSLRKHITLIHRNCFEIKMYQCDTCEYQTKWRGSLKRHVLTHKNSSGVQIYRCEKCKYQTNRNSNLKRHIRMGHKDSCKPQSH